jgi:hypothetical protein
VLVSQAEVSKAAPGMPVAGLVDRGGVEGLGCESAAEERQGADLDAGGVGRGPGGDLDGGTLVLAEPRVAITAQADSARLVARVFAHEK